jgi:WhiB family transcriptional regulator, redox-sensing transcriptional regulator
MSHVLHAARSLSWMSRGACRQADPELFFPIAAATGPAARQVEAAKAVCSRCVVSANCLSYALEAMPEGIWGGTTPEERRAVRGTSLRQARHAASQGIPPVVMHDELAGQPSSAHLNNRERQDTMSIARTIVHKAEAVKGTGKRMAGRVTGSRRLRAEGRADQTTGDIKQAGAKIKDASEH